MRYGVRYLTRAANTGLMLFSAEDSEAAAIYVKELVTLHDHYAVFNLQELKEGTIAELYRLFPGVSQVVVRGGEVSKAGKLETPSSEK